jgi:hemerythrin-like domain-containing protein
MMSPTNRVSQTLHQEHAATVALMERLEQFLVRHRRGAMPDTNDRSVAQFLADLSIALTAEVERHFAFEENKLFPYLAATGDEAIGLHLTDEHRAIRPLSVRLASLARDASTRGFNADEWQDFSRVGQELYERMLIHVQKEEMALLPLLDEAMDADTEARLYEEYVEHV